ncbi:MAG: DivIVA domain-containing protein [Acidimicrobiia bacterium]|nr:DivIVA domain-containing protein [Acidimicrobiia bacterium]
MAMSFSRPDPASPAAVADASFKTSRRGFDQGEVHEFLRMVAAELGRLQERERFLERELRNAQSNPDLNAVDFDDAALTRLLGEETARVLTTARESANEIRNKAEQSGAQLLMEASDEAARVREEADIESARRRADATADAESEIEMAKQQGREMVNEARAYRERVLSELARRRELAREQIEQLVHGRDRLTQAFERARLVAADVVAELEPLGEPNEYVNLSPTTGPVPVMVVNEPSPSEPLLADTDMDDSVDVGIAPTEAVADAEIVVAETGETDAAEPGPEPELEEAEGTGQEIDGEPSDDVELVEEEESDDAAVDEVAVDAFAGADDVAADDAAEDDAAADDAIADDAAADDAIAPVIELVIEASGADTGSGDATGAEGAADQTVEVAAEIEGGVPAEADAAVPAVDDADDVGADDGAESGGDEVVVDLFARLRAETGDAAESAVADESTGAVAAEGSATLVGDLVEVPAETTETATDADDDQGETPFGRRDAELTPLIVSSGKKLKRVLADEQNEVLEALRRGDAVTDIDAVLPAADEHLARYCDAISSELIDAANAGAQAITGGSVGKLRKKQAGTAGGAGAEVVEEWLVMPLRERLDRCVAEGDGDNAVVSRRARSVYREWKTQHIDEQLDDVVRMAYGRGAFEAVAAGTPLVWSVDGDHPACPDCDDNGLSGPVAAGDDYPTGHAFAPAHPGCRCLLLPPGR